jgi:CRISPR type III-B/RAMP module RAMP protein Cmr6
MSIKETVQNIQEYIKDNSIKENGPINPSLVFDKYLSVKENADIKLKNIKKCIEFSEGIHGTDQYRNFFESHKKSFETYVKSLRNGCEESSKRRFKLISRDFQVRTRLSLSQSDASIHETSIRLHPVYSVPYISAESLKGLCSHFAHKKLHDSENEEYWRRGIGEGQTYLFGSTDQRGAVTFSDALPLPFGKEYSGQIQNLIDRDVITNHHQKYYKGGSIPPTDSEDTVPLSILTARGLYRVYMLGENTEGALDFAGMVLEQSLSLWGVGGKTIGMGYGRMKRINPSTS